MSQVATKSRTPKRSRRDASRAARLRPRRGASEGAEARDSAEHRIGQGGRRLADAFEAVSSMPVLAESRRRLLLASEDGPRRPASSPTRSSPTPRLTIAVMRAAANNDGGGTDGAGRRVRRSRP